MKVYHVPNTRSIRVLWVLEEIGAPYETETVAFPPRPNAPHYLQVNPAGTIPAVVDGDVGLTDSMAICQYLAEKHGRADLQVAEGAPERPDYLQWLWFGEATAAPPLSMIARIRRLPSQEGTAPMVEDARAAFAARLAALDRRLKGRDYLVADRFTLADVSVAYPLNLTGLFGISDMMPPGVAAYFERLRARPAFQRAIAAR
jgi:glutathione S-transferase